MFVLALVLTCSRGSSFRIMFGWMRCGLSCRLTSWLTGRTTNRLKVKIRDWYQVKDIRWEKKKRGRNRVIQNGIHWIWYDIMHYSFESPSSKYIQMHRARTEQSRVINIEIWSIRFYLVGREVGRLSTKGRIREEKKTERRKFELMKREKIRLEMWRF